jgi:Pycsar effector protein
VRPVMSRTENLHPEIGLFIVHNLPVPWPTFAKKIGFPAMRETKVPPSADRRVANETLLYANLLLGSAKEEIDRADAKASILLAASGVAAGALLAGLIAGSWSPLRLQAAIQWAWWLGVAESATAIWCLALAVYPREQKNDSGFSWAVAYYGDVLAYRTTAQLVTALNRSAETNIERIADQLRHVSWIVDHKYRLIRWGMRLLFLAVATISAAMMVNLILLNY